MNQVRFFSARSLIHILLLFFPVFTFAQYRVDVLMESAKKDISKNNMTEAMQKLNICIEMEPANAEAYFFRAACKYTLFDNAGAEEDFTSAMNSYTPYYYEAYHYRSEVRYRLGNYSGAMDDINKAIEKQEKDPRLLIERSFIELAMTRYKEAISDCNAAIRMGAIGEDPYLCRAAAQDALADFDNALCDYDYVVKNNPKNVDALVRRGVTKVHLDWINDAIVDYNAALALDSAYTFAYYNRAEAEEKKSDHKSALRDYSTVIEYEHNNAYAYFNRAVVYSNMQKYKAAISDFDRVLQINPENIEALFNRAKLKQNTKDLKGAMSDCDKIIQLYPYFVEAYFNRAQIKYELRDAAGSQKDIETGKMMGEVFQSKNNSQLRRDSAMMVNLLHLNADFNSTPKSAVDTLNIQFRPLFYIMEKSKSENVDVAYSALLSKISKVENKSFVFSNQEPGVHDSVNSDRQEDKRNWSEIFRKTNSFYINDAAAMISEMIRHDTLNAVGYFQRAVITCREVELLGKFETPSPGGNSSFDIEKGKINSKILSALNDFGKALQLDPGFYIACFNRGNVKCMLGDFEGALKDYETALRINADFADAHFNSGFVLYYLNEKNSACTEFSRAGELGIPSSYSFLKKYCLTIAK